MTACRTHRTPQPFCPHCPVPPEQRATPDQIANHRQRARELAANPQEDS